MQDNLSGITLREKKVAASQIQRYIAPLTAEIDRHLSAGALADLKAAGLTYTNTIWMSPSAVRVKFVVRDAESGRIGTVNARLPR